MICIVRFALDCVEYKSQKEVLQMTKCSYCGKEYDLHKGLTLVMKDGIINHFCSAKCRKNKEMKRRKVRWISQNKKT